MEPQKFGKTVKHFSLFPDKSVPTQCLFCVQTLPHFSRASCVSGRDEWFGDAYQNLMSNVRLRFKLTNSENPQRSTLLITSPSSVVGLYVGLKVGV